MAHSPTYVTAVAFCEMMKTLRETPIPDSVWYLFLTESEHTIYRDRGWITQGPDGNYYTTRQAWLDGIAPIGIEVRDRLPIPVS